MCREWGRSRMRCTTPAACACASCRLLQTRSSMASCRCREDENMNSFQWANAGSVEDAVKLLKPPDGKVDPDERPQAIGGGQDLLTSLKAYIVRPPRVINLKTIGGLDKIE